MNSDTTNWVSARCNCRDVSGHCNNREGTNSSINASYSSPGRVYEHNHWKFSPLRIFQSTVVYFEGKLVTPIDLCIFIAMWKIFKEELFVFYLLTFSRISISLTGSGDVFWSDGCFTTRCCDNTSNVTSDLRHSHADRTYADDLFCTTSDSFDSETSYSKTPSSGTSLLSSKTS